MNRLLPLALVPLCAALLSACGGATTTPTILPGQSIVPGVTSGVVATPGPGGTASTIATPPGQATAAADVVIPAACATGFTAYLKLIEPVVADFDPKTDVFADFFDAEDAASDKGFDAMSDNGGQATYSCSEVGLEFNYFDTHSPWAAIYEIAKAQAPGTVAYLQTEDKFSAIDDAAMTDYGAATCEDAVAKIKKDVADQKGAGTDTVDDMGVDGALALFGLYSAYLDEVQAGNCPPDVLGNDEFDFMGSH